jgi:sugar lactone lactonase YvrE
VRALLSTTITEYQTLPKNSGPNGIASDGTHLWVALQASNQIAEIDPSTGAVIGTPIAVPVIPGAVGGATAQPYSIVVDKGGRVWFTEYGDGGIGMYDPNNPSNGVTPYPLPSTNGGLYASGAQPEGLTVAPDGNIWFTENAANLVGWINPTTTLPNSPSTTQVYPLPPGGTNPDQITSTSDGRIWFTESLANAIGMFNPAIPSAPITQIPLKLTAGMSGKGIAVGSDGNLWIGVENLAPTPTDGAVVRVDPNGKLLPQSYPDIATGASPSGVAYVTAGSDGKIWLSEASGGNIGWIDPSSPGIPQLQSTPTKKYSLLGQLVKGPSGIVWFTDTGNDFVDVVHVGQATSISAISGSGTYGGTSKLTATLLAGGNGIANEPVTFTFINGNTVTTVGSATTDANGVATLTGVSLAGIGAGTYAGYVGASFTGDTNYGGSNGSGDLAVAQAPLTITADIPSKFYGAALPALTYTYTGLVNGDTSATFTGSLATTATSSSAVGTYPVSQGTLAATGNYTIHTFNPGTLTVNQVRLTITANDVTKAFGAPVPALTASYSGFVAGDTAASLTTPPTLSTTATASSQVVSGGYPIKVSGAVDPNYSISYVPRTLTVTQATPTLVVSAPSGVFNGSPFPVSVTITGAGNATPAASLEGVAPILTYYVGSGTSGTDLGSTPPVQPGMYTVVAMFPGSTDYAAVQSSPVTFSISRAATKIVLVLEPVFKKKHKLVSLGLTAEVQPIPPGVGEPTGTVTFKAQKKTRKKVTEQVLGTIPLSGGSATLTVKPRSVLEKSVTILYGGDAAFQASNLSASV